MNRHALLVNKLHAPVTVLGPGRRLGIWLQGCRIRCKGCVSQDTWTFDTTRAMPVRDLAAWCRRTIAAAPDTITGITISGGEPFDQPEGLKALLDLLAAERIGGCRSGDSVRLPGRREGGGAPVDAASAAAGIDVLCYSGYPLQTLQDKHADILARLDALIPEPYVDALPLEKRWRGSANQALVPLSELGRVRYADYLDAPAPKEMQVAFEGGRIWFIGLPDRGDMPRLEALCRQRGVDFGQVSWRR